MIRATVLGIAILSLSVAIIAFFLHPQGLIAGIMWGIFFFIGLVAFAGTVTTVFDWPAILRGQRRWPMTGPGLVLLLWLLGTIAFLSLSAPFIAIRHVFLLLPVILLALGIHLARVGVSATHQTTHILIVGILGLGLALSDYTFAGVYRQAPSMLRMRLGKDTTVYHAGHWGWQWYAERQGFRQYAYLQTKFEEGNILIIAEGISAQRINPVHLVGLREVERVRLASSASPWLRAMSPAQDGMGFYAYGFPFSSPYTISGIKYSFRILKFSSAQPAV